MDTLENQTVCKEQYSSRCAYSSRELKSKEDWNEWQANALGAALLMPAVFLAQAMEHRPKIECSKGRVTGGVHPYRINRVYKTLFTRHEDTTGQAASSTLLSEKFLKFL